MRTDAQADSLNDTNNPEYWGDRLRFYEQEKQKLHFSVWLGAEIEPIDKIHQAFIEQTIPAGSSVLDVGCGYGRIFPWMSAYRYVGVDFSTALLSKARELHRDIFMVGDVLKGLTFRDHEFDYAVAVGMEGMWKRSGHWAQAVKEMKRVAKHVLVMEMGIDHKPYVL